MLEKLACLQHEIWSHWMKHLFKVSTLNDDGSVTIPPEKVERWKRQLNTHYFDLSDDEQKSDIEQAKKVINLISDKDLKS